MKCEQETHGTKKHTQGIKIDPTFIEVDGKVKEKHFLHRKNRRT